MNFCVFSSSCSETPRFHRVGSITSGFDDCFVVVLIKYNVTIKAYLWSRSPLHHVHHAALSPWPFAPAWWHLAQTKWEAPDKHLSCHLGPLKAEQPGWQVGGGGGGGDVSVSGSEASVCLLHLSGSKGETRWDSLTFGPTHTHVHTAALSAPALPLLPTPSNYSSTFSWTLYRGVPSHYSRQLATAKGQLLHATTRLKVSSHGAGRCHGPMSRAGTGWGSTPTQTNVCIRQVQMLLEQVFTRVVDPGLGLRWCVRMCLGGRVFSVLMAFIRNELLLFEEWIITIWQLSKIC